MKIKLNNNEKTVSTGTTLVQLLEEMNLDESNGLAVAVNQEVISANRWKNLVLNDDDSVLILHAIAGG